MSIISRVNREALRTTFAELKTSHPEIIHPAAKSKRVLAWVANTYKPGNEPNLYPWTIMYASYKKNLEKINNKKAGK